MRSLPRPAVLSAVVCFAVLALLGSRYGFHRDELYFVEAGHHPDWSYPDQPPLVPLLASAWHEVVGGSLLGFRLLPALLVAAVVLVGALTCRELGGDSRDQAWTAVVVATSSTVLAVGHLFSTATFDLLLTSTAVLLLARVVARTTWVDWLALAVVTALALQVKLLPVLVLACAALALVLVGPRYVLARPGPWVAAALAALTTLPWALWQSARGWPQLQVAASIAEGGSGSSVDRALLLPLLLTLTGPLVAGVLVIGAVALWRTPGRRWLALTAVLLVVLVLVTGGKPYYVVGLLPVLVASGVPPVRRCAAGSRRRRRLLVGVVAANLVGGAMVVLPVWPSGSLPGWVVAANYDAGETVGWPELVAEVERVQGRYPADTVLASNYGIAGALDRARRSGTGLPPVASGHLGYAAWSQPSASVRDVLVVGYQDERALELWFSRCEQVGVTPVTDGVENDAAGSPIHSCTGPRASWDQLWPRITRL